MFIELIRLAGVAIVKRILDGGYTSRKNSISWYAILIGIISAIFLISSNFFDDLQVFLFVFVVIVFFLVILNDCFNNALIPMYNLEVTIAPTYSVIILIRNLCEAAYSFGFFFALN